jgi:hypothetical protein
MLTNQNNTISLNDILDAWTIRRAKGYRFAVAKIENGSATLMAGTEAKSQGMAQVSADRMASYNPGNTFKVVSL